MNVKTLTGPSIQAALADAREAFGDEVVLIESVGAQDGRPARITVMIDEATPQPAQFGYGGGQQPQSRTSRRLPAARQTPAHAAAVEERAEPARESFSGGLLDVAVGDDAPNVMTAPRRTATQTRTQPRAQLAPQHYQDESYAPRTGGRGRLFAEDPAQQPAASLQLQQQLSTLTQRLEQMEHRLRDEEETGPRWTAHPLFAELLQKGLRPATLTALFEEADERGLTLETEDDELRWALAQSLRRRLRKTAPPRTVAAGTLMLVGPGGAGKTSMLLKLATGQSLFGRSNPAVIAILPEDADALPHANPADVYRRFGLPVQSVSTPEEMQQALDRVQGFDTVLIDTPPMPLQERAARQMLKRLHRFVGHVAPLNVQLVLDATRALDEWEPGFLKGLPLAPQAAVLTHLDETRGWGRLAEWMMTMELPVPFVSDTPRIPDGAHAYSPTWFVEELLSL